MNSVKSRFLSAVRHHEMTILQDDGLYRHIGFSKPHSSAYRFSLVTWPGYLVIAGDCDDYIFARTRDMFSFFRFAGPDYDKTDRTNVGYWAEKVTSQSSRAGLMVFSESLYQQAVISDFRNYTAGMPPADKKVIWSEIREDLLYSLPETTHDAIERTSSFRCPLTQELPFGDFWEHGLSEYSFGFKWACHAVQWGIKQYDLAKQGRTQADVDRRILAGDL